MLIAVIEYWMAMTFASWQKTYFVTQLFGWYSSTSSTSAGGIASGAPIWTIKRSSLFLPEAAQFPKAASALLIKPGYWVRLAFLARADNSAKVCCFSSHA